MPRLSLLLLLLSALSLSEGRVVSRCELRDEILQHVTIRRNQERILARVVCEVERRSALNTALVREYDREIFRLDEPASVSVNAVKFFGVFQLSDRKFCDSKFNNTEASKCRSVCDVFADEDISDDVECFVRSKVIWEVYRGASRACRRRRTLDSFFDECEAGKTPPPAPHVIVRLSMSGGTYK